MAVVHLTPNPVIAVITPYALGVMADDSHKAAVGFNSDKKMIPRLNYYLYCVAIELTFKAAFLSKDCIKERKEFLRKKIGHDLIKAMEACKEDFDLSFLNSEDCELLVKINPFFKDKALEYFTGYMMGEMLMGHKNLPGLIDTENVSEKINIFLKDNNLFRNGETSYEPESAEGIIQFV